MPLKGRPEPDIIHTITAALSPKPCAFIINLSSNDAKNNHTVDKIIKGTNPVELPVEVNSKIEFAIHLKTAKPLGITIPPEVLYRADQIVR